MVNRVNVIPDTPNNYEIGGNVKFSFLGEVRFGVILALLINKRRLKVKCKNGTIHLVGLTTNDSEYCHLL
jgi:hypothetical protein